MALRECVLLVNGSHIRSWWISHHIWSAVGSLLMLSLPISSPSKCSSAQTRVGWVQCNAVCAVGQPLQSDTGVPAGGQNVAALDKARPWLLVPCLVYQQ